MLLSPLIESGRQLDIRDLGSIRQILIEQLQKGVDPSKLGDQLLEAIGTGKHFTGKALRVLSGHLPKGMSTPRERNTDTPEEDTDILELKIREIIESKKESPDPSVLYIILVRTNFEWGKMQEYMRDWSAQALINLNNCIYDAVQDGVTLGKNARKYVDIKNCISSQLTHKEGFRVTEENPKTFYGETLTVQNKTETPSEHRIYSMTIKKEN